MRPALLSLLAAVSRAACGPDPRSRCLQVRLGQHRRVIPDSCAAQLREMWPRSVADSSRLTISMLLRMLGSRIAGEPPAQRKLEPLQPGASIFWNPMDGSAQFELPYATCGDTIFMHFIASGPGGADPARPASRGLGSGWSYFINSYVGGEPANAAPGK